MNLDIDFVEAGWPNDCCSVYRLEIRGSGFCFPFGSKSIIRKPNGYPFILKMAP